MPTTTLVCTMTEHSEKPSVAPSRSYSRNENSAGGPLPLIPRRVSSNSRSTLTTPLVSAPSTPKAIWTSPVITEASPPGIQCPSSSPLTRTNPSSSEISESGSSSNESESARLKPSALASAPRIRRLRARKTASLSSAETSNLISSAASSTRDHISRCQSPIEPVAKVDASETTCLPAPVLQQPIVNVKPASIRPAFGSLRLDIPSHQRHCSESRLEAFHASALEDSIHIPASVEAKLIRKKSGEPVKSSLKSPKPKARGDLFVITSAFGSKSEPNTPTSKAVHFDAQLEHVKLFLAEQKPLAVSRDGSPTDDTSGTDTDFPSFIFGKDDDETMRKLDLVMRLNNFPPSVDRRADVTLEGMALSEDMTSIAGNVRVRNLAFHKWIAVRFTFDNWQTTSEVAGKHVESSEGGTFDRFSFLIRLTDLLARIEEKTLLLAIRYSIEGREIWDNNRGLNYNSSFTKTKRKQNVPTARKADDGSKGNDIGDLTSRLEKVAVGCVPTSPDPGSTPAEREKPPVLKEVTSLSSRYDFGTSLRNPWTPASFPTPPPPTRSYSHPSGASSTLKPYKSPPSIKIGVNKKANLMLCKEDTDVLGSPRDSECPRIQIGPQITSDPEDLPFPKPLPSRVVRNHQRFSIYPEVSTVKRTPPGTPTVTAFDSAVKLQNPVASFPQLDDTKLAVPTVDLGPPRLEILSFGSSEESTPTSASSVNSSRSSSPCPSPSPTELFLARLSSQTDRHGPSGDYIEFLNQFCFFTGSKDLAVPPLEDMEEIARLSKENLTLQDTKFNTPSRKQLSTLRFPPAAAPVIDENNSRSGSSTPTPRDLVSDSDPVPA